MKPLLSTAEIRAWLAAYLVVAALLAATGFASTDPDSALHANLSARLAEGPVSQWIVPHWWGEWDSEGLYREHPAGIFLLPTALARLGVPAVPASYIVGVAAGLAALILIAHLAARLTTTADGRAALVLLQLMPVAFLFRVRANHEYPMLVCLLLAIVGLEGVQRSWRWAAVVAAACTAAMLIKGVFVAIVFAGAGLWVIIDPARSRVSWWRPIGAAALALTVMASVAWLYDVWYTSVAGESFWRGYWLRQMAPLTVATPVGDAPALASRVGFYLTRLAWHPAPWSVMLLALAWRARGRWRDLWSSATPGARRGALWCLVFAATSIALLSPASRFAERYTFSAAFAIGAYGSVAAHRGFPRLSSAFNRLDAAVPALPVLVWTLLMLFRLALGPMLPRFSMT